MYENWREISRRGLARQREEIHPSVIPIIDFYSGNNPPHFKEMLYIRKVSMGGGPDARVAEDFAAIRSVNGLPAAYHWCDPTQSAVRQAGFFLDMISKHNPVLIAFDIEQTHPWRADGRGYDYNADPLKADQIYANARTVVEYVTSRVDKPYLLYTGRWYTASYCPQLGPWIGNQPAWIASYPDYYFLWPKVDKAQRQPYHLADYDPINPRAKTVEEYLAWMKTEWMAVPTGATNVKAWQITSRLINDGELYPFDLSKWLGDWDDYVKFLRLGNSK